eukprot:TRINITY_DN15854_c0_g1_i1.p1 TRINITY_DN15854_c0_g1~~TRINITY_DN15854_c0_g1_i1.p1  ORF type:complete len:441 (+),score=72.80 TRINITY_DN15854_c0_g1_i1:44-1366(+)
MKVKVISRDEAEYVKQRPTDLQQVQRNYDPQVHPLLKAREYVRTLNAVKLDKIFAKPFVAALSGHADGVYSLCRSPKQLTAMLSGSGDGEVKLWDLAQCEQVSSFKAHAGIVWGLTFSPNGQQFISCGDDTTAKLWSLARPSEAKTTFLSSSPLRSVDHHWTDALFATAGDVVAVWDQNRTEPIHTFSWGADSATFVRFNRTEHNIFVSAAHDRSLVLYDIRQQTPIRKLLHKMKTNSVCWNPMEAFNFTTAGEDHNCYTYDMRHLDKAKLIHKDHVDAVMTIDYSPTGQEFVTGSYDRTIRIFPYTEGRSREVYHTKRMQRIFSVQYSPDARFVLSGSDDTNVRLWKAEASRSLKTPVPREQKKLEYLDKLKERHKDLPEIRRIVRHKHVPRFIKKEQYKKRIATVTAQRHTDNKRKHTAQGTVPFENARKKHIINADE